MAFLSGNMVKLYQLYLKGSYLSEIPHIPVLLSQTLESFSTIKEGTIIDCTLGYGGHSEALLKRYPHIKVIGIDRDQMAIDFATKRLASFGDRFQTIKGDFASSFEKALEKDPDFEPALRQLSRWLWWTCIRKSAV